MTGSRITIAAALCWYDESPDMLARCVASLAGFADIIVSLDGPYSHFPHATRRSPDEQHRAIYEAAREHRIPHAPLCHPAEPMTQTEKRTTLYRAAASMAGANGWLLIIDADERLTDRGARASLERSGAGFDAATVLVKTRGTDAPHPRMIRAHNLLTCGPQYHGMLSATGEDGRRICIRDRREFIMSEHPRPRRSRELDLSRQLEIHNDTDNRPDARKAAKREYIRRRMADGIDL